MEPTEQPFSSEPNEQDPLLQEDLKKESESSSDDSSLPCVVRKHRMILFCLVSGVIVSLLCGAVLIALPTIVEEVVWNEVAITSSSSRLFEAWVNPTAAGVNIYREFTFYNLTNPLEVLQGFPPNFVERGPYVYSEVRAKDRNSIRWFPNNTVGYTYSSTFFFQPDLSYDAFTGEALDPTDVLILANAPLIGLTHRLSRTANDLGKIWIFNVTKQECCVLLDLMVNESVGAQGVFTPRSVHEVLWGYEDPIWHAVHLELHALNYTAGQIFRTEWNGSYVVPSPYTFRSGQMCPLWDSLDVCNTTTNLYTLEGSGAKRNEGVHTGYLEQWAGQRKLWWWGEPKDGYTMGSEIAPMPTYGIPNYVEDALDEDPCHAMTGSDGFRFGPGVTRNSTLTMFLDMLWRVVPINYWQDTRVKGIDAYSFALQGGLLDNGSAFNRHCFQMKNYGLLNFSRPLFGPAFATKARFLDARLSAAEVNYTMQRPICLHWSNDMNLTCLEWGLSERQPVLDYPETYYQRDSEPDQFRQRFESHLDVNGLTGMTLRGVANGEALTTLKPIMVGGCEGMGLFKIAENISETLFPLVNAKRSTEVSDKYASTLREAILWLLIAHIALYCGLGLGGALLVVSAGLLLRRRVLMKRMAYAAVN